jgi:hypothetical protein
LTSYRERCGASTSTSPASQTSRAVPRSAPLGLAVPRPVSNDWPPYQRVGERLFADGFRGVLAPSAARPSGRALRVFDPLRVTGVTPRRPPVLIVEPPAPPRGMTT